MCPYCSANTQALRPGPPDLRPLSVLRLNNQEWAQYREKSQPSAMYKRTDESSNKLRVVGFNDDTKNVLRDCNPKGEDYIEVAWSAMDSILWIAHRIEDKIHVALHHWVLATSDGVIFKSFGELVCTSTAFRASGTITLTLLVPSDLPEFLASHVKQHAWTRLTPGSTESPDMLEKAKAEFHLIEPQPSSDWKTYVAERQKDSSHVLKSLAQSSGEDLPFIYDKIEEAIDNAISFTDLDPTEADVLHDCVLPISPSSEDDGWGNIRGAEIFSRIYSPYRTGAVDVYLDYWYRTRYESVEFFCTVWYRPYSTVSQPLKRTVPQSEKKPNGFKKLFQMGLKDMPPGRRWRAVDERTFDILEFDVSGLHRILFGEQLQEPKEAGYNKDALSERFGKADMIELMLASVGISFRAARDKEEIDSYDMGDMTWEGLRGSDRWLGKNIRRVCGIQALDGDDKESEEEEIDDDDDDDDDDDEDDEWEDEPRYRRRDDGCAHQ